MRADPEVLAEVVAAARTASDPVAALPEQEVRRHIAALLGVVSAAFVDGSGLSREHAESAARLATDRAVQGFRWTRCSTASWPGGPPHCGSSPPGWPGPTYRQLCCSRR